jgi:integrase
VGIVNKEFKSKGVRFLTPDQVQQIRESCNPVTPKGKRDLAIIDAMLFQGMRLKEVASLRLEQFFLVENQYYIQLKQRPGLIRIHPEFFDSLKNWLDQRGIDLKNNAGPIFIPIKQTNQVAHKPLGNGTISHLVAVYGNLAGIAPIKGPDRLFPSDLRRTCSRRAYDRGVRLTSIQAFLGFNYLKSAVNFIGISESGNPNNVIDQIMY